jgi:hypothetical protein
MLENVTVEFVLPKVVVAIGVYVEPAAIMTP